MAASEHPFERPQLAGRTSSACCLATLLSFARRLAGTRPPVEFERRSSWNCLTIFRRKIPFVFSYLCVRSSGPGSVRPRLYVWAGCRADQTCGATLVLGVWSPWWHPVRKPRLARCSFFCHSRRGLTELVPSWASLITQWPTARASSPSIVISSTFGSTFGSA